MCDKGSRLVRQLTAHSPRPAQLSGFHRLSWQEGSGVQEGMIKKAKTVPNQHNSDLVRPFFFFFPSRKGSASTITHCRWLLPQLPDWGEGRRGRRLWGNESGEMIAVVLARLQRAETKWNRPSVLKQSKARLLYLLWHMDLRGSFRRIRSMLH